MAINLSNVDIGSGPGVGDGDPVRSAFNTVNQNFTILETNVNALTNSVTSVAGRTGNVTLTTQDIVGFNATNFPNASTISTWITSNVAAIVDSAPDALNTLNEIAAAINDDANAYSALTTTITTANVNMKGYVDSTFLTDYTVTSSDVVAHQANLSITESQISDLQSYLTSYTETNDLTASVTWTNIPDANVPESAVTQHQAALSITESQISDLQSYLTSYTVTSSDVTQHQANLTITESQISDLGHNTYANADVLAYLTTNSYATETYVNTANTNVVGYVDSAVSTANVNLKGYADATFATVGTIYNDTDVAVYLNGNLDANLIPETNSLFDLGDTTHRFKDAYIQGTITLGNTSIYYADVQNWNTAYGWGDHSTQGYGLSSDITTANVNLKGYVDNELTSYATTSALTTANVNVVGYVDGEITTVNSALTTANTNVVGYVDNAVSTANVNLKGYVDSEISGLSLGNISTITLDGNVSNVLAGDGTFITAGSGGTSYTDSDVDAHLNQSNPTSGYVLSWNGSDYAWVDNAGYADSDVNTLLASWGSNSLSTTGNVTAANFIGNVSLTGNITGTSANVTLVAGAYEWEFDTTGNVSFANGTVSATTINAVDVTLTGNIDATVDGVDIGYKTIPQVSAGNVTIGLSDSGKHYYSTASNPTTLTIPLNSSVAFDIGTAISIVNQGTGNVSVALTGGVSMYLAGNSTSSARTITSYGMATLMKVATDTWFINGTGVN